MQQYPTQLSGHVIYVMTFHSVETGRHSMESNNNVYIQAYTTKQLMACDLLNR